MTLRILILAAVLVSNARPAVFAAGQEAEDARYTDLKALAEGLKIDIARLAGSDAKLGELEAYKLLERMKEEKRRPPGPSRKFLSAVLAPDRFVAPGASTGWTSAALRIIGAISLEVRGAPDSSTGFSDLLLPLLGIGGEQLREGVVEAFRAIVEQEKRRAPGAGGEGPPGQKVLTIQRLCRLVEHNPPPASAVLEDVSKILWESDGKLFLSHLIGGMVLNQEKYPASTPLYLKELRERLRLGFATPKGWSLWWKEQQDLSLPEIFVKVQKKLSQDNAANWKQSLKRFRETRDYELLLAELQATLQSAYTVEHRIAAVEALGEYADWLRGARLSDAKASEQEKLRLALQARACERLLMVIKGEGNPGFEQPRVRRQALISLRHYQSFLAESAAEMRKEIIDFTVNQTQALLAERPAVPGSAGYVAWREELLELIRAAGAFKIPSAKKSLDAVLNDRELYSDLELQLESIQALGHLLKSSLDLVSASLFIERFKEAAELSETDALRLRIACVTALNARPEDDTVLGLLRTFHAELLRKSAELQLQMPAIAGLSTLAQSKDPESLEALLGVLSSPEVFDTQVLIAAVDAISYVGNQEALDEFLPFLKLVDATQAREKALGVHLMKRVQGLIKTEGIERLAWVMGRLENRACIEDNVSYLVSCLRLVDDAALKGLLLPAEPESLPTNGKLNLAWEATLSRFRAADLAGDFDESISSYKKMAEFLSGQPQVGESSPADLREFKARLRQQELKEKIFSLAGDPGKLEVNRLLELFTTLVLAADFSVVKARGAVLSPRAYARWASLRWIELFLSTDLVPAGPKETALYADWNTYLAAEDNAAFWRVLPEGHRVACLKRLEALRTRDEKETEQE